LIYITGAICDIRASLLLQYNNIYNEIVADQDQV